MKEVFHEGRVSIFSSSFPRETKTLLFLQNSKQLSLRVKLHHLLKTLKAEFKRTLSQIKKTKREFESVFCAEEEEEGALV